VQDPTPTEQIWLMQMLGNFGEKQNLYIIFFAHPPPTHTPLSQKRFRATAIESLVCVYAYEYHTAFSNAHSKFNVADWDTTMAYSDVATGGVGG